MIWVLSGFSPGSQRSAGKSAPLVKNKTVLRVGGALSVMRLRGNTVAEALSSLSEPG